MRGIVQDSASENKCGNKQKLHMMPNKNSEILYFHNNGSAINNTSRLEVVQLTGSTLEILGIVLRLSKH